MSKRAIVIPLIILVVATLLFFVISGRWTAWSGGRAEQEIDDDDYRSVLEQARAALAASQATLNVNQAAKQIQEAKIQNAEAMVAEAEAAVSAARAGVASTQPQVERTALERRRQEALLASKATTKQQLESAVADAGQY